MNLFLPLKFVEIFDVLKWGNLPWKFNKHMSHGFLTTCLEWEKDAYVKNVHS